MTAFWAMAARDWPPSYPTHELAVSVGSVRVAELHDAGVLREEAIRAYGTVTCRECHGDARVVYEPGGAVAICTGDFGCPDQELGPAPTRSAMVAADFARRLAGALGLDGVPGREGLLTPLGRRRIGDEEVAFDLCSHPGRPESLDALAALVRRGPSVRVVLVPCAARLRADMPTDVGGVELVWVGLDEVVRLDGGFAVELGPILARRPFRGAAPAFGGLILTEHAATWSGRPVLGPGQHRALELLRALAARPGEWVPRRELWRVVSPGEFTRAGKLSKGVNPDNLDGQLRGVVLEVREALAAAGLPVGVPNRRGDEVTGGYRLALAPDQVRRG